MAIPADRWQKIHEKLKNLTEEELDKVESFADFLHQQSASQSGGEATQTFWKSFGAWETNQSAEQIIAELYDSRRSSSREISL